MAATLSSETSVLTRAILRHIPGDGILQTGLVAGLETCIRQVLSSKLGRDIGYL
jgi:hypothetical protein